MKANQAFRLDDEAVSPVIGVILMVAITVVLAAVVFVLVTKLSGNNTDNTPSIGFNSSTAAKSVTVTSADPGTTWGQIKAKVTCSAGNPVLTRNTSAVTLTAGVADPVLIGAETAATAPALSGGTDTLAVSCSTTTAGTTVSLALTWKPSNTQVGTTWTFTY